MSLPFLLGRLVRDVARSTWVVIAHVLVTIAIIAAMGLIMWVVSGVFSAIGDRGAEVELGGR